MDLIVIVAAAGLGFGGYAILQGEWALDPGPAIVGLWLTACGYAFLAYGVARIFQSDSARLIVLGVALAFGASGIGLIFASHLGMEEELFVSVGGLMLVALVLVAGGILHGVLDRWHEWAHPTGLAKGAPTRSPHPLDPEETL